MPSSAWAAPPASASPAATKAASPLGPDKGRLRFLEVKGRVTGADTVTVTKNEILMSLNRPDDFILALVAFLHGDTHRVHYLRRPFQREPEFGVTSVNYAFAELLARAEEPA